MSQLDARLGGGTLGKTLLIVDDEDSVRRSLARTLRDDGYVIHQAPSGEEGLKFLTEHRVDMVMSDQKMPGMNGIDFLNHVRIQHPDTMRLLLTGFADLDMAISAINNGGIYRFLTKPWDNNELRLSVKLGFDRLLLERENRELLKLVKRQSQYIRDLEREHPGIADVDRDARGAVVIDEDDVNDDVDRVFVASLGKASD
jgi:two-component system, probable response regulator PhcQ